MDHKCRGTWFSNIHRRYYELDGSLMRNKERQRHVRKISTVMEASLSDHKPKRLRVDVGKNRCRGMKEVKRRPNIRWEKLQGEGVEQAYCALMEERMREYEVRRGLNGEELGEMTGWVEFAELVVEGAKEVCGVRQKSVENPWMVGKEEEIAWLNRNVTLCVERKIGEVEKERRGEENHRGARIAESGEE